MPTGNDEADFPGGRTRVCARNFLSGGSTYLKPFVVRDHEYGTNGVPDDFLGNTADKEPAEPGTSMRPYHDQVDALLKKIPLTVSFSRQDDETAGACKYVCPEGHWLEQWNDAEPDEQGVMDPAIIDRGRTVFTKYCACCHGPKGAGDGLVARRGFPPPTSYAVGKSNAMKDGQIFHILTYGKGNMPSHAAQVPREDRWKVILYVRQLLAKAKAELAKAEETALPP